MRLIYSSVVAVFLTVGASAQPACELLLGGTTFPLHQQWDPTHKNLEIVFTLLEQFKSSGEITKRVRQRIEKDEIAILRITPEHVKASGYDRAAVLFSYEEGRPRFFVNSEELGVLATLLFHEMVHADDAEYKKSLFAWEAERDKLVEERKTVKIPSDAFYKWVAKAERNEQDRQDMIFAAERKAYDAQFAFLEELKEAAPCVAAYLAHCEKDELMVTTDATDDQIRSTYLKR